MGFPFFSPMNAEVCAEEGSGQKRKGLFFEGKCAIIAKHRKQMYLFGDSLRKDVLGQGRLLGEEPWRQVLCTLALRFFVYGTNRAEGIPVRFAEFCAGDRPIFGMDGKQRS